jgi:hypothetical protein
LRRALAGSANAVAGAATHAKTANHGQIVSLAGRAGRCNSISMNKPSFFEAPYLAHPEDGSSNAMSQTIDD